MKTDWQRLEGWGRKHYYVHDGDWRCVILDDLLSRSRPYKVLYFSHVESGHNNLETAKKRVLELLQEAK